MKLEGEQNDLARQRLLWTALANTALKLGDKPIMVEALWALGTMRPGGKSSLESEASSAS